MRLFRKILQDKRGGEKYMSFWWFFVIIVISVGIVLSVSLHNSAEVNIKKLESDILITRVVGCIVENGFVDENFLNKDFDMFLECGLDREVINESGKYYLEIEEYDFDDCELKDDKLECQNPGLLFVAGKADLKNQCEMREGKKARYYAECFERYVYVLNENSKGLILYFFAGSNQDGKKEVVSG